MHCQCRDTFVELDSAHPLQCVFTKVIAKPCVELVLRQVSHLPNSIALEVQTDFNLGCNRLQQPSELPTSELNAGTDSRKTTDKFPTYVEACSCSTPGSSVSTMTSFCSKLDPLLI